MHDFTQVAFALLRDRLFVLYFDPFMIREESSEIEEEEGA
jgi:hypothetical protein